MLNIPCSLVGEPISQGIRNEQKHAFCRKKLSQWLFRSIIIYLRKIVVLIEAINIQKEYPGPLHVLKGVDLGLVAGEVVAIVGPSGAGKSTLLHILGGLDAPKEGQVIFNGQNLYGLSDTKRAQTRNSDMGFVFQFYHLLPELTALENVILPAMIKEKSGKTSA